MVRDVRIVDDLSVDPDRSLVPAPRLVAGVATLAAVVLVTGVVVSARGVDAADQATTVSAGALVVTASGRHVAKDGETVPRGAEVRTADGATLVTGGREVALAPGTAVTVLDGVRQRVTEGSVLVTTPVDGPRLTLSSPAATLRVPGRRAAVRLDLGSQLRATSYEGTAVLSVPGRKVTRTVGRLHALQVAQGSAPGAAAPLHLRDGDPWERSVLPAVVANDLDLQGLVRDFARPGSPVAATLPAAERPVDSRDADVVTAERTLAYALASGRTDATYREALALRQAGGSWGVVAALVEAESSNVARYVNALSGPDTSTVLADPALDAAAVLPGLDAPGVPPGPSAAPPAARPTPTTGPGPRPRPTPAPSAPPAVVPVPEPVATLLAPVLDLLPVEVPLLPRPSTPRPQVPVVGPLVDRVVTPPR